MTKKTVAALVTTGVLALALAGCSEPAQDRPDATADGYKDATHVIIWRNANQVPNVAMFCADGLAFAATLSSDGAKQPQLIRIPERDNTCSR